MACSKQFLRVVSTVFFWLIKNDENIGLFVEEVLNLIEDDDK